MQRFIVIPVILLTGFFLVAVGYAELKADNTVKAVFAVRCYDVGAAALEGQPGVLSIDKGWHGSNEVNRVVYDPGKVTLKQIEQRLKESGTYIRTVSDSVKDSDQKAVRE